MKKTFKRRVFIAITLITMLLLAACTNGQKNGNTESVEATDTNSQEGSSEETTSTESDDILYAPEAGMTIDTPPTYLANQDKVYLYYDGYEVEDDLYEMYIYLYPDTYDNLMAMTDDEYTAIENTIVNVLSVYKAKDEAWTQEDLLNWMKWAEEIDDPSVEILKQDGDYTIYYSTDSNVPEEVPEDLAPVYEGIISELLAAKDNIVFSEPVSYAEVDQGNVISFTSTNVVDGSEVKSEDLFSNNEITMINFWTSWCGPCIQEMPELEELSKTLAEKNCGIIGVLYDGNTETGLADGQDVIKDTGVTYPNVVVWDTVDEVVHIQAYPTTYFVNSDGVIVGEAVVGADPDKYMEQIDALLKN